MVLRFIISSTVFWRVGFHRVTFCYVFVIYSHLESEITRLKSTLLAERKLRSLQYEAIRSLWSQVQKLNLNNNVSNNSSFRSSGGGGGVGVMTQSCPNGLPATAAAAVTASEKHGVTATVSFDGGCKQQLSSSCACTQEIKELRGKIEELGGLVGRLLERGNNVAKNEALKEVPVQVLPPQSAVSSGADKKKKKFFEDEEEECRTVGGDMGGGTGAASSGCGSNNNGKKRPDTLDLVGSSGNNNKSQQQQRPPATGEELQGYADEMAKYVVERGISDNNSGTRPTAGCGDQGENSTAATKME